MSRKGNVSAKTFAHTREIVIKVNPVIKLKIGEETVELEDILGQVIALFDKAEPSIKQLKKKDWKKIYEETEALRKKFPDLISLMDEMSSQGIIGVMKSIDLTGSMERGFLTKEETRLAMGVISQYFILHSLTVIALTRKRTLTKHAFFRLVRGYDLVRNTFQVMYSLGALSSARETSAKRKAKPGLNEKEVKLLEDAARFKKRAQQMTGKKVSPENRYLYKQMLLLMEEQTVRGELQDMAQASRAMMKARMWSESERRRFYSSFRKFHSIKKRGENRQS